MAQPGVVAAGEHEQRDVRGAHDGVGAANSSASPPKAPGTHIAATSSAAIAANMTSRTEPSSGSTTLVSQA